jgi:hypothetical protein
MKNKETLEKAAEKYAKQFDYAEDSSPQLDFIKGANWQQEQILQFLYSEITERRDYSASKMCEKVVEFIKQNQKK